jgi:hypothetical protein
MTETDKERLRQRLTALSASKSPANSAIEKMKHGRKKDRGAPRVATYRVGRVIYGGRNSTQCVIKDMSENGARIVLEGEAALPPQVTLVIAQSGVRRTAAVIWQNDREVGLAFAASAA